MTIARIILTTACTLMDFDLPQRMATLLTNLSSVFGSLPKQDIVASGKA
jgi:hypothetical protein